MSELGFRFWLSARLGWVSDHEPPSEDRAAPPDVVTWHEVMVEKRRQLWEWLLLDYRRMLAITVLTAPLVATQFHVVSLVGMIVNILLIPLTTVTLICGYVAIFVGLLVPPVAAIIAARSIGCCRPCNWACRCRQMFNLAS